MRDCQSNGGCTACCVTREVAELNKPAGMPCAHQTPGGCAIYETRPSACRAFACLWLDGWGALGDRPDRLGVVLTFPQAGHALYHAYEAVPGALTRPATRERLDDLKADVGLLEVSIHQKQTLGGALASVETMVKQAKRTVRARQAKR